MAKTIENTETRRALVEQAHQLHELTRHPGWAVLVDFMEVRMRADKVRVLNGKCVDLTEYKDLTGFLQGVHAVLDAPKSVATLADNARKRAAEEHTPEPEAA